MTSRTILTSIVYIIVFNALQILFMRQLDLFGLAFCFCYIGTVVLMPIKINPAWPMLAGFAFGLVLDFFQDTPGLHASAGVLTGYLRIFSLNFNTPAGGYEDYMEPTVYSMGVPWYLGYTLPLLFVHHLFLFLIEYAGVGQFLMAIIKTLCSMVFTIAVMLLVQAATASSKQ
ncbi:MAG: hypothetical protein ACOVMN_06695 [Flexibacteraceae bacterium]